LDYIFSFLGVTSNHDNHHMSWSLLVRLFMRFWNSSQQSDNSHLNRWFSDYGKGLNRLPLSLGCSNQAAEVRPKLIWVFLSFKCCHASLDHRVHWQCMGRYHSVVAV
jgi:hypothetical protein